VDWLSRGEKYLVDSDPFLVPLLNESPPLNRIHADTKVLNHAPAPVEHLSHSLPQLAKPLNFPLRSLLDGLRFVCACLFLVCIRVQLVPLAVILLKAVLFLWKNGVQLSGLRSLGFRGAAVVLKALFFLSKRSRI
jgi:hypothetical protein